MFDQARSSSLSAAQQFPNGSLIVQRTNQELEVWGANLSEHYCIQIYHAPDERVDVIYLGSPQVQRT